MPATAAQVESIAQLAAAVCRAHGWPDPAARIVGHDQQAVWTPETTGLRKDGVPVLAVPAVQVKLQVKLLDSAAVK